MPKCIIYPNKASLTGNIEASPSKSQTLRAILFASMADGSSTIDNILLSPDAKAMVLACEQLGAKVAQVGKKLLIQGTGGKLQMPDNIIDAGNSGIVLRFIGALCSHLSCFTVITGDHSIRHLRPVKPLLDGLKQLGVFAESMRGDNHAPIIIKGPVIHNTTILDGADSQPVSGLIISSLLSEGETVINVANPGERPWVDLTIAWFDYLNLKYQRQEYTQFVIPGVQRIPSFEYYVPSDLSSISFPVAAALVTNSKITINKVDLSDQQGDKKLLEIFKKMGANLEYNEYNKQLNVYQHEGLHGINTDINDCIDVINILSVVACYAKGQSKISGAKIARSKECDRIAAIARELSKMGATVSEFDDGLVINQSNLRSTENLCSYNDHRMVMSLFIAALGINTNNSVNDDAPMISSIVDVACISKSYPDFFNHMHLLGVNFELID